MIPQYTEAPAYKLIESFCRMIGVEIRYGTVPPNAFAVAEVDDCPPRIRMSVNMNDAFAQRVLGHELGHHLVERLYRGELENVDYLIELQCDQIGNALYLLANRIIEEADANGIDVLSHVNDALVAEIGACNNDSSI